jgi:hypothetical protein
MEEAIAVLAEFKLDEMFLLKRTLHEEAIVKLLQWKTRQIRRENPEIGEDGKPVDDEEKSQEWKQGPNTMQDMVLCQQLFKNGG